MFPQDIGFDTGFRFPPLRSAKLRIVPIVEDSSPTGHGYGSALMTLDSTEQSLGKRVLYGLQQLLTSCPSHQSLVTACRPSSRVTMVLLRHSVSSVHRNSSTLPVPLKTGPWGSLVRTSGIIWRPEVLTSYSLNTPEFGALH